MKSEMKIAGSRNLCMDTIKGIACIFVVLIHYNWGGEGSNALKAIGRFAVPYFYFLSGYHLPDRDGNLTRKPLGRKTARTLKLLLSSALIYSVFCVYWNSIMDSSWNLWTFTKEKITRDWLIKLMLSCDPAVYAHFWYLIASVMCHGVLWVICKPLEKNKAYYALLFGILLCTYSMFAEFNELLGLKNFVYYTEKSRLVVSNTFMLRAMPFILCGIAMKKYRVAEKKALPAWLLIALAVTGAVLSVFEDRKFGVTLMYTGTHLMVIALALLSVWYPDKKIGALTFIGGKLSMYVYIYHIAVGKLLDLLATKLHWWGIAPFKTMRPVIVLAGSLLFAAFLVWLEAQNRRRTAQ